jgi:hypothetical protein
MPLRPIAAGGSTPTQHAAFRGSETPIFDQLRLEYDIEQSLWETMNRGF